MQRHSKQRDIILRNLKNRCDHPTADMVYTSVREELPNISLGTVYRNLNSMSDEHVILRFTIDGLDHFDGNAKPHVHLICTCCGSIEDYDAKPSTVYALAPGFTQISNVIVQGKCRVCSS